ncbi:MAG: aminoacyl-tRNA hydrolase [Mycoplasmoidaceae bacterium]
MAKFLIIGLGNPGTNYQKTKHNVGFMALDSFALSHQQEFLGNIYNGIFIKLQNEDQEVYLLKPQTFMNLSGECVFSFLNFYKIPIENVLVIYDDVDLPLGTFKLREVGSSGGQKGMKNIIEKLKTEKIKRIKIGIGRPKNKASSLANYVLSNFNEEDKIIIDQLLSKVIKIMNDFPKKDFKKIMSEYNGS